MSFPTVVEKMNTALPVLTENLIVEDVVEISEIYQHAANACQPKNV